MHRMECPSSSGSRNRKGHPAAPRLGSTEQTQGKTHCKLPSTLPAILLRAWLHLNLQLTRKQEEKFRSRSRSAQSLHAGYVPGWLMSCCYKRTSNIACLIIVVREHTASCAFESSNTCSHTELEQKEYTVPQNLFMNDQETPRSSMYDAATKSVALLSTAAICDPLVQGHLQQFFQMGT